jgi:signal transduction histidine kinase
LKELLQDATQVLREMLQALGGVAGDTARSLRVLLVKAGPDWRAGLARVAVVLFGAWLIATTIADHGFDHSVGYAFLTIAIAYLAFTMFRPRFQALARTPTVRGMLIFALLLWLLNGLIAESMGTYAAIVATVVMVGGFLAGASRPDRTPVRRLLVALLLSLVPLGYMAYDYWKLLGEEYAEAEDRITDDMRAKIAPVLKGMRADLAAELQKLDRIRSRDELIADRVAEISRSDLVEFAYYLPLEPGRGNVMIAMRGSALPLEALPRGDRTQLDLVSYRIYADPGNSRKLKTHSSTFQSERAGHGYFRAYTVPGDGHYGASYDMGRIAAQIGGKQLAQRKLAGKVRVVEAGRAAEGEVVLVRPEEMPEGWDFAQVVLTPEAFEQAKNAISFRQMLSQVWFAVLVLWLAAAFGHMYRTATKDLALADMKSNFVSAVTHELKTPLGMIRMYSEMLLLGLVGEGKKQEDYLNIISGESDRLARLIDNVLDFSKIQRGRKTYDFADVDLREVAVSALRNLEGAFDAAGKEVDLAAPEPLVVLADRDAAFQAVLNLLSNAIKYGGPHVRVELIRAGPEIHVAVHDDGPGIPADKQALVFQPFVRLGREEERTAQGTGLGLSLVSEIMRAHHGAVRLDSQPGLGATFTLAFPAPPLSQEVAA